MFIDRQWCLYPSMSALMENARRTGVYPSPDRLTQIGSSVCISDALLYVQSNGRVQLGQDELGRMHYLSAVAKRDFPLPTLTAESDQLIAAHSGMFYQADVAMMLGKLHFSLALKDGTVVTAGDEGSCSCYLDHFLPMTTVATHGLRLTAFSLAPVLEPNVPSAIPGLPLPGPSGAIHALHIRNESDEEVLADASLMLNEQFVTQYQYSHRPIDESAHRLFQAEWDHNLLFMWRPDVCAMVQAQGFSHAGNPGLPSFLRHIELKPDEEITLTCLAVISTDVMDLHPALAALYRHTALEWINLAAHFWRERLGSLRAPGGDALEQRSMDFHMRSVLDNFNCYQMNEAGEIVAHLQGAPSQVSGRLWGIDAEPTALSVLYALPELGGPILRYISERNKPLYSAYSDHSTPIFLAPMIIAAKYFELTGDLTLFARGGRLSEKLTADARELLALRHPSGLVPSHYSSDGHVFNRYDFGANCKAYYAFTGFGRVLAAMGEGDLAEAFAGAAEKLRCAVREHMSADGPFGPQITGGNNMGEHDPFYLRDDLMYYDGEDSSSCLAPLYGILDACDPLWQNYHRFASSLFATNYDAEADALRWFAWGSAIDGTALVSAVGGCTTRPDMKRRLQNMLDLSTDETGTMFWWPRARNYVRNLTRCSQGQGAWVFQHTEQWLGLRINAGARRLVVRAEGAYGSYEWLGLRLGAGKFDIRLQEEADVLNLCVVNRTGDHYEVELCGRSPDEAFCDGGRASGVVAPGEELALRVPHAWRTAPKLLSVAEVENHVCAPDGPALGTYLFSLPAYDTEPGVFILPLALLSGPEALADAALRIDAPEDFSVQPKRPALLDELDDLSQIARMELDDVAASERLALPVYLALPVRYAKSDAWLTRAPFASLRQDEPLRLMLRSDGFESLGELKIELTWMTKDGAASTVRLAIPVEALPAAEFDRIKIDLFGGTCTALHERLS